MQGIAKVSDDYQIEPFDMHTIITNPIYSVWYSDDEIKIYDHTKNNKSLLFLENGITLKTSTFKKVEEISYKEYNDIIKELKERRIINNIKQPEEPYIVDTEHSTNTTIKVVPRPGFEVGKMKYYVFEYFETLGAAYPVERWKWFENKPYDIKVDKRKYCPGYTFVPEESTINQSVYKIVWPRKKDFEKTNVVWR